MNLEEIKARLSEDLASPNEHDVPAPPFSPRARREERARLVLDDRADLVRVVEAADALDIAAAEDLDEDLSCNASAARLRARLAVYREARA